MHELESWLARTRKIRCMPHESRPHQSPPAVVTQAAKLWRLRQHESRIPWRRFHCCFRINTTDRVTQLMIKHSGLIHQFVETRKTTTYHTEIWCNRREGWCRKREACCSHVRKFATIVIGHISPPQWTKEHALIKMNEYERRKVTKFSMSILSWCEFGANGWSFFIFFITNKHHCHNTSFSDTAQGPFTTNLRRSHTHTHTHTFEHANCYAWASIMEFFTVRDKNESSIISIASPM